MYGSFRVLRAQLSSDNPYYLEKSSETKDPEDDSPYTVIAPKGSPPNGLVSAENIVQMLRCAMCVE